MFLAPKGSQHAAIWVVFRKLIPTQVSTPCALVNTPHLLSVDAVGMVKLMAIPRWTEFWGRLRRWNNTLQHVWKVYRSLSGEFVLIKSEIAATSFDFVHWLFCYFRSIDLLLLHLLLETAMAKWANGNKNKQKGTPKKAVICGTMHLLLESEL